MDKIKIIIFGIVAFIILVMWGGLMFLIMRYGHEVQTDPCSICASRMGNDVICTMSSSGGTVTRLYAKNESIIDSETYNATFQEFNLSLLEVR